MSDKPIEIEGVYWEKNYYAATGSNSYTLVANKGPLITDLFHYKENAYEANYLSVGQTNRYTFFGDKDQKIKAKLVDCRASSSTLHKTVELEFYPDPTKCLIIDRGISEYFEGLTNITVRSEPVLFSTDKPNGYEVGNDVIAIPLNKEENEYPIVYPNDLPLPTDALQFLLKREQQLLKSGAKIKNISTLYLENKFHRVGMVNKAD